jgi:polysaccharide chain length determinant protein (PEP-CTERM system associated)
VIVDTTHQIKQYLDIAWRRKWWVIAPAVLGLAASVYLATVLPKMYRASTTILVLRQSVPTDLVQSTVTMRIEERMKSLRIQVMSRRYLERVVKELGFATSDASDAELERACEELEASVDLDWDKRDLSWFNIMVTDRQPQRAADVANRLADLFIEQNTQMRAAQAQGTVDTVEGWLEKTEADLRRRDALIADYKAKHIYELPDQQGAALQLLTSAQARVQQLTSDIQSRTERLAILRLEEKSRRASAETLGVASANEDPDSRALAQMSRELQELLSSYTEANPLVKRKRAQIEQFKATHPDLEAPTVGSEPVMSPELARLEADLRGLESDRKREQENIDELRRRLSNMPLRLQELTTLTRDYDALKARYDSTSAQREQAQRAQDIEVARKGEQFQVQDRARPPAVPFKPNFVQLLMMGLFGGLALGVGIAMGLEFLDQTIRSEEEFAGRFPDLTILGSIPGLESDSTPSRGLLSRRAKKSAAAGAVLLGAALVHVFMAGGGILA